MSFKSIPNDSLTNIVCQEQPPLIKFSTEPNICLDVKIKSTRANIHVKKKKTKYSYPLGIYTVDVIEESKHSE